VLGSQHVYIIKMFSNHVNLLQVNSQHHKQHTEGVAQLYSDSEEAMS
jgi:hypothetical protein